MISFFIVEQIRRRMKELGYDLAFASDAQIIEAARRFAQEVAA